MRYAFLCNERDIQIKMAFFQQNQINLNVLILSTCSLFRTVFLIFFIDSKNVNIHQSFSVDASRSVSVHSCKVLGSPVARRDNDATEVMLMTC